MSAKLDLAKVNYNSNYTRKYGINLSQMRSPHITILIHLFQGETKKLLVLELQHDYKIFIYSLLN
jgi:hypothetical protein